MKRIAQFRSLLYITLAIGILVAPSCATEEDPAGPTDERDRLVDGWTCDEVSSQTGQSTFSVVISKSSSSASQVLIQNFYAVGNAYQAKMTVGGNTLTLPQQVYNGNQLSGSGNISGNNSFSLTYYINNGSTIDTCSATFTRQ